MKMSEEKCKSRIKSDQVGISRNKSDRVGKVGNPKKVRRKVVSHTIVVVPPFPDCIEQDRHDVPLEDCWYARPPALLHMCYASKE